MRKGGGKVGCMYQRAKDSNAVVRVHDRATLKASEVCDRQTDKLSTHYRRMTFCHNQPQTQRSVILA